MTRQGLFSDQGDVLVSTDEGVVYTLRYGGPIFAEGDELVVGKADDAETKDAPAKKDAGKAKKETQENRYLMVTALVRPGDDPQARVDGTQARDKTDGAGEYPRQAVCP